ncbi:probable protein phosphatase 2C 1 isoform X4 [Lycium ferocissimum]|uniref:probable protein phosphatase 2C 1 isoform X4 n=1 Tax=Lycium ferocissimum TaxID=112874 RepID=UPI0028156FA0|nr:probable protein phosphatase 2C 1 isoform X4 [Lycium ferocissimum]
MVFPVGLKRTWILHCSPENWCLMFLLWRGMRRYRHCRDIPKFQISFMRRIILTNSDLYFRVNYDPRILIKGAHAATSSIGSATVIVSTLEDGILKIASVGDCGLRVIRKGQMIFSTFPLEHYFDCPYQLSSEAVTQTYLDAIVSTVDLQIGDTIIMGSDGLFDNVFDQEIVSVVTTNDDVSNAAKALADLARNHSVDTKFDSPYSLEARARGLDVPWWKKFFGMKLTGGKLDDITVIVGKVKNS